MSIKDLSAAIKNAVDNRIKHEAMAKRGTIQNGKFHCGAKSYPYKLAVDCNLNGKVWAQLTPDGTAVVVGA